MGFRNIHPRVEQARGLSQKAFESLNKGAATSCLFAGDDLNGHDMCGNRKQPSG
jgi:hypothetical protein